MEDLTELERKEMIEVIHINHGYSKEFLKEKSNNELFDKILRMEVITKYGDWHFGRKEYIKVIR